MSRPLYRIHPKVVAELHRRGLTVERLAALAGTGRAHATQVLANKPGRGHLTRRRIAPHLAPQELELLGWSRDGARLDPCHKERSNPILNAFRRNDAPAEPKP